MTTAVILGAGPEIDFFFSEDPSKRQAVLPFSTDASDGHPQRYDPQIPVLNLLQRQKSTARLMAAGVSRIVAIGSLKPKGIKFVSGVARPDVRRLALAGLQGSDKFRETYFEMLGSDFEFPLVKSVLPFLFVPYEVREHPDPDPDIDDDIVKSILSMKASSEVDPEISLHGFNAKIFRVPKGPAANLIHRQLNLDKMIEAHRRSVTHFYFDLDRTIIVGLKEMIAYAKEHRITLQSFSEP